MQGIDSPTLLHDARVAFHYAVQAIIAYGFRSFLTTLGIVIGISAVIAVVAIMQGLGAMVEHQLKDLGTNTITLRAYTSPSKEMLGISNTITYQEYLRLRDSFADRVQMAAKMRAFSFSADVRHKQKSTATQILGTESAYQRVVNVYPASGRYLSPGDEQRRRRVMVIGHSLIESLGLLNDAVGEFVQIKDEWFRIIGVAEKKGSIFGLDQDNYVILPLSTVSSLLGDELGIDVVFTVKDESVVNRTIEAMSAVLRQGRKLSASEPDFFEFETAEKTRQQFSDITRSITYVAAGVVGISLLVGGVGIMNIMWSSVTERTREIGIAKALGATSRFVLAQFLFEAMLLALLGGVAGVILGYGVAAFVLLFMPVSVDVLVPAWALWAALGFSAMLGVIFGTLPALKASRFELIEALRYE